MKTHFGRIVDEHRDRVFTYAYYSLGNREEAEDVTQEVLLRLWRYWDQVEETHLRAWLNRVTRNACIDVARRRRAYTARVVSGACGGEVVDGVSSEPWPDARAEASDARALIRAALAKLDEPYRSVVILREVQDMKYDEIGKSLDLPLNTVKSYLHRGRRMLRERLSEMMTHDAR
jgi:RNA polymerase sigma factor (sigma-70 family)